MEYPHVPRNHDGKLSAEELRSWRGGQVAADRLQTGSKTIQDHQKTIKPYNTTKKLLRTNHSIYSMPFQIIMVFTDFPHD